MIAKLASKIDHVCRGRLMMILPRFSFLFACIFSFMANAAFAHHVAHKLEEVHIATQGAHDWCKTKYAEVAR